LEAGAVIFPWISTNGCVVLVAVLCDEIHFFYIISEFTITVTVATWSVEKERLR
jgi:hypothetical protein